MNRESVTKEYISETTILKERNWTKGLIKQFLKKPDKTTINPIYKSQAKMKLYFLKRVEEVESTIEFKNDLKRIANKRQKLSNSQKKRMENQRNLLRKYIENLEVLIPKYSKMKLTEMACAHYNDYWALSDKFACLDSDQNFLNRISVNFLRHEMTNYDDELTRLFGKVGKYEGYILLKIKILKEISFVYPYLKGECNSQSNSTL